MRQPLAAGLRHEGDGGRGEEDAARIGHHAFGEAQRRERLACAAGHDELAAAVALRYEAVVCGVDGVLLQRLRVPRFCWLLEFADFVVEVIQEVDAGNPWFALGYRPLGRSVPSTRRDDPAQSERGPCGLGQEAVDVRPAEHRVFGVALALDGDQRVVGLNRHQVDALVAAIEAGEAFPVRPIAPRPDVLDVELRVVADGRHEQVLEPAAFLRFAAGLAADATQGVPDPLARTHIKSRLLRRHAPISPSPDGTPRRQGALSHTKVRCRRQPERMRQLAG